MTSFEVDADTANVNLQRGTVILTGVMVSDLVSEIGAQTLLEEMDFSTVHEYVIERLNEDKE